MAKAKPAPIAVSVVVPWRPTPDREPVWAWLRQQWARRFPAWEIVEGACPDDGPWRKGIAVADGIARAAHDVLVIADADVWTDDVAQAVEAVASGRAGWSTPAHIVKRLTAAATADVLDVGVLPTVRTGMTLAERPYPVHPGGGMTVITRAGYEQAPIDPRFTGWGQEDDAWALCMRILLGREHRGGGDLWHLHHTAQPRMSRSLGSSASAALHRRYIGAKSSPRSMAALVAEHRSVSVA